MNISKANYFIILILFNLLAQFPLAFAGGTVSTPTEAALQAALTGGGTVTFACNGTITLTKTLTITQDTTLDATGYLVTLSGGNAVRLFAVTNATFRVSGLTLADGRAAGADGAAASPAGEDGIGGCLLNQGGTIVLTGCTLTNHLAQGGNAYNGGAGHAWGGGIYSSRGQINLTNCLVVNCTAVGGIGLINYGSAAFSGVGRGGAFCVIDGSLNFQGVTLGTNRAIGGQASNVNDPLSAADACGGAIYATNSSVCAGRSVLANNAATGGFARTNYAASGNGSGGALFLDTACVGVIERCLFSTNSATSADPGYHRAAGSAWGGAVFNAGQLRAVASTFAGNGVASVSAMYGDRLGQGGAVYSTNTLELTGCTFDGNVARGGKGYTYYPTSHFPGGPGEGGGVWSSGLLAATNTTWVGNRAHGGSCSGIADAPSSGGGLCTAGGSASLMNVTLSGNYARQDDGVTRDCFPGPAQGGNLMNSNGVVWLRNSILAYGTIITLTNYLGEVVLQGSNVWGTVTDGGYNLSSDTTGDFAAPGSLMNTDPLLGPLTSNGGPTATCWPLPGSPARDQIPSGFPTTDQRGAPRPQGPAADLGAVEADSSAAPAFTLLPVCSGHQLTLTLPAESWRCYRLLCSTDLVTWTAIATNSPAATGPLQFTPPMTNPKAFYRVVTP